MNFTTDWFELTAKEIWDRIVPHFRPNRYLEIGSWEGASTCYIIEKCGSQRDLDIVCIDTWEGGVEHSGMDMKSVRDRFDKNIKEAISKCGNNINLNVIQDTSLRALSGLNVSGQFNGEFEMIYIDGSHIARDVLADGILSFPLLRVGGVMVFDDYVWDDRGTFAGKPLETPKMAVDTFSLFYSSKVRLVDVGSQAAFVKIAD